MNTEINQNTLTTKDKLDINNSTNSNELLSSFYDKDLVDFNFLEIPYLQEKIILPSFYRCGNTLTRELIEGVTKIVTGSDDNHTKYTQTVLGEKEIPSAHLNFKGSYTVDKSVWVYKTHFPARKGIGVYSFEKIILVVRNAFDAIDSMFNLFTTNSHTDSINEDMYLKYDQEWENFVEEQTDSYNAFYLYWLRLAFKNDIPLLIIRYEDLIKNNKEQLIKILQFMLNYKSLGNKFIEERIDAYLKNRLLLYIPRKGTSYHSIIHYKDSQVKNIMKVCGFLNVFFDYNSELLSNLKDSISNDDFNTIKANYAGIREKLIKNNKVENKIFKCLNYLYKYLYKDIEEDITIKDFEEFKKTKVFKYIEEMDFDINKVEGFIYFEVINKYSLSYVCVNNVYTSDVIIVPNRTESKLKTLEVDTSELDVDYCFLYKSKSTIKRLLNDVSQEIELEKKVDMTELRKLYKKQRKYILFFLNTI